MYSYHQVPYQRFSKVIYYRYLNIFERRIQMSSINWSWSLEISWKMSWAYLTMIARSCSSIATLFSIALLASGKTFVVHNLKPERGWNSILLYHCGLVENFFPMSSDRYQVSITTTGIDRLTCSLRHGRETYKDIHQNLKQIFLKIQMYAMRGKRIWDC